MRKWIFVTLVTVFCLAVMTMASADTGFTITEVGMDEWTLFKDAGIMTQTSVYYNVLFNATGIDTSKSITLAGVSSPFQLEWCSVEYYGINSYGWQSDETTNTDYYGSINFYISEDVFQDLECKDYTINFTISHNGQTATIPCLIHILDNPPKTPESITGYEASYTIRPDETITITPVIQPTDWAGSYLTIINFYAGKKDGNSISYQLSSQENTYAVKMGDNDTKLLLYSYTDTSMSITGKVPGFYKASIILYAPGTNTQYNLNIPITVLNADGSSPVYVPTIYYEIDNDFSGTNNGTYFYETTRYKSDLTLWINCYMDDYENTGVLNDLVNAEGVQALEGQVFLTGPDNKEYVYEINGYQPSAQAGMDLSYLGTGSSISLGDLPVGDYHGSITMYWYGELLSVNITLHRRSNSTGEPSALSGINNLYIIKPGDQITLPYNVTPSGWVAPEMVYWYSNLSSVTDWEGTYVYYVDDSWRIVNGNHFTCERIEGASGLTDIYTAEDSGYYEISISMQCADYELQKSSFVVVLNADGSTPDGAFGSYLAGNFATISIPKNTTTVQSEAFANTPDNAVVYFPASVTTIAPNAFSGVNGLVIVGYRNTAAESFAQQNGYVFVPLQN